MLEADAKFQKQYLVGRSVALVCERVLMALADVQQIRPGAVANNCPEDLGGN